MSFTKIKKISEKFNIEVQLYSNRNCERMKLYSLRIPSKEYIIELLGILDENTSLQFFDYFHQQISDPGAYITIRCKNQSLAYMKGNHGWQSNWKNTDEEYMSKYIIKNWKYGDYSNQYVNYVIIEKEKYFYF